MLGLVAALQDVTVQPSEVEGFRLIRSRRRATLSWILPCVAVGLWFGYFPPHSRILIAIGQVIGMHNNWSTRCVWCEVPLYPRVP
jgi:hypothetical protein